MLPQCFFVNWYVGKNKPSPQKILILSQFLKNTKQLQVPLLTEKIHKEQFIHSHYSRSIVLEAIFAHSCVTCKYWERKVIFYCVTFMEQQYTVCERFLFIPCCCYNPSLSTNCQTPKSTLEKQIL